MRLSFLAFQSKTNATLWHHSKMCTLCYIYWLAWRATCLLSDYWIKLNALTNTFNSFTLKDLSGTLFFCINEKKNQRSLGSWYHTVVFVSLESCRLYLLTYWLSLWPYPVTFALQVAFRQWISCRMEFGIWRVSDLIVT